MTIAVAITLAILVIAAAVGGYAWVHRNPRARYRRDLRGIRRIQRGIRGGEPNATSIGANRDAVVGYRSGQVGP